MIQKTLSVPKVANGIRGNVVQLQGRISKGKEIVPGGQSLRNQANPPSFSVPKKPFTKPALENCTRKGPKTEDKSPQTKTVIVHKILRVLSHWKSFDRVKTHCIAVKSKLCYA